jgi:hypothetical protein
VPTSRVRFGHARVDITPPVGIYHRMWGAARHDRATGLHRPLFADVIALGPLEDGEVGCLQVHIDGVGLAENQDDALRRGISRATGVAVERIVLIYSHTHAGGVFWPDRIALPGGELIPSYLEDLGEKLAQAAGAAIRQLRPVTITYGTGWCDLAVNRDYWDEEMGGYTCGYNPDGPADKTVVVARVSGLGGQTIATLVNYACHPTTLAWENTLISPDYVGALREEVERVVGAPCIFALGPCGDLGPRRGYVGDPAIADQNGRQLAYAALSVLSALGPPGTDFQYTGPIVSGATLGTWTDVQQNVARAAATAYFGGGSYLIELPRKVLPDRDVLEEELDRWEAERRLAKARGDPIAARECGARAERARRWLGRLAILPEGATYRLPFSVFRLGDAVWVTTGGEPYNRLQTEVRRRFPEFVIIMSPLNGGGAAMYLLPRECYGTGRYQEEPSILGPGCLERLIDAVSEQISALRS